MKEHSFDRDLLEGGSLLRRGYAYIAANSGKIIALITALVAALVTFTDVALTGFGTAEFTTTLLVMLIASYLIYFSLEDAGERLGEESEEYREASARYLEARRKIQPEHIDKLREYLASYSERELSYRRRSYLCREGCSAISYEKYKAGERVTASEAKAFRRMDRMKPVGITPTSLLSRYGADARELVNPNVARRVGSLLKLLPSTVCMFFTASVILTAKPDLTPSVIIEGILKLSALPIVGFKGYSSGYAFALGAGLSWLETKTRLLEGFIDTVNAENATRPETCVGEIS